MQLSGPIELIKKSIEIFFKKNNFIYFLKVYGILSVFALLTYIFDIITHNFNFNFNLASLSQSIGSIPVVFLIIVSIVGLAYLIVSFWVSAAGIVAVSSIVSGVKMPVKQVFASTWKKLFMFSILGILVGIVVGLGFVLLIIPGIIFWVWFNFTQFEFLTKNKNIGSSISGSKKIVAGKFWPVFGRILVFGIFGILVQVIIGLIPLNLGSIVEPLFGGLLILPNFLLYTELNG